MSTTKTISNQALLNILLAKSENAIDGPQPTARYKVTSNPIEDRNGNYFFNIDAMSVYHIDQAEIALNEGRYSDITKGFTVTLWKNGSDFNHLPNIFKGAQVYVEIVEFQLKDENGELMFDDNKQPVMGLSTKFINSIVPEAPKTVNMSSRFASYVLPEEDELED